MTRIDRVLSQLSKLYEFNINIRRYKIRETDSNVKESSSAPHQMELHQLRLKEVEE